MRKDIEKRSRQSEPELDHIRRIVRNPVTRIVALEVARDFWDELYEKTHVSDEDRKRFRETFMVGRTRRDTEETLRAINAVLEDSPQGGVEVTLFDRNSAPIPSLNISDVNNRREGNS